MPKLNIDELRAKREPIEFTLNGKTHVAKHITFAATEAIKAMQKQGYNQDVRLLEGSIVSTSPPTFAPDLSGEPALARFTEAVANGASVGQRVLALQDMTTQQIYVIARLV